MTAAAPSLSAEIARFAVGPISDSASAGAMMRLSAFDWAAVAAAGANEPVAQAVRAMIDDEGGAAQASVIGRAERAPARAAALSNGATSHALDYDDTHFAYVGHRSVAVIPAALAAAEMTGAGMEAMLEAALIGAESACRIGMWLGRAHYNHGFHQTSTAGAFGAAMAAARLLGLSAAQAQQALGVASTRASGLKSQFGAMGKPYNAGMAAANGLEAALLARRGFVSNPFGLECEQGFGATHAGECGDPSAVLADLGAVWIFEGVQHKFHACCHGLHAGLEAIGAARRLHQIRPEQVRALRIRTNPRWLLVCDKPAPATGLEAKFSFRLTAAMALCGWDTAALDSYSAAACADPALIALRDAVRAVGDDGVGDSAARVEIDLLSGETIVAEHDLDAPIALEARAAKLRAKAVGLLGEARAGALWAACGDGRTEALTTILRAAG